MGSRNLIDAAPSLRRGGSDSTVTRTCRATGEALLAPRRNHRSRVDRITGSTGKSIEGERVTDGFEVASKRGNACGAKEPFCLRGLRPQGRQGRADKGVHRSAGPEAENIRQGEGRDVLEGRGALRPRLLVGHSTRGVCGGQKERWVSGKWRGGLRSHRSARRRGV